MLARANRDQTGGSIRWRNPRWFAEDLYHSRDRIPGAGAFVDGSNTHSCSFTAIAWASPGLLRSFRVTMQKYRWPLSINLVRRTWNPRARR